MDISPVRKIPIIISRGTEEDRSNLETFGLILEALIAPESITWKESKDDGPLAATAIAGTMDIHLEAEKKVAEFGQTKKNDTYNKIMYTDIVFKSNPIRLLSGHKEILFQSNTIEDIISKNY